MKRRAVTGDQSINADQPYVGPTLNPCSTTETSIEHRVMCRTSTGVASGTGVSDRLRCMRAQAVGVGRPVLYSLASYGMMLGENGRWERWRERETTSLLEEGGCHLKHLNVKSGVPRRTIQEFKGSPESKQLTRYLKWLSHFEDILFWKHGLCRTSGISWASKNSAGLAHSGTDTDSGGEGWFTKSKLLDGAFWRFLFSSFT